MKKNVLLVILLILIGYSVSKAQSSLLATLSHEGDVKVFYGAEALINAHEAAVSGDVITLSSGAFHAVDITKAVTIRGAGMAVDTVNNIMPTVLKGDFVISESDSIYNLTLEGIYHNDYLYYSGTLYRPQFIKCRLNVVTSNNSTSGYESNGNYIRYSNYINNYSNTSFHKYVKGQMNEASFLNCRIAKYISIFGYTDNIFNNCVVENPSCLGYEFSSTYVSSNGKNSTVSNTTRGAFIFYNCVINMENNPISAFGRQSDFYNCIIVYGGEDTMIGYGQTYNTISVGTTTDIFKDLVINHGNKTCDFGVFKTYKEIISVAEIDEETFELTDEAAAKYLGRDKTQVGIYGGSLPYNTTIEAPRIVKCDVASKSTSDGKLSVDIQVEMAE